MFKLTFASLIMFVCLLIMIVYLGLKLYRYLDLVVFGLPEIPRYKVMKVNSKRVRQDYPVKDDDPEDDINLDSLNKDVLDLVEVERDGTFSKS